MAKREREHVWKHKQVERQAEAEGEADSPQSREPDVGLDPRTLGSGPELKADASPAEPSRCPNSFERIKGIAGS